MLTSLDDSVGSIIKSLEENEMLNDSIILFISDNGAPTEDLLWGHRNTGSNWPLRGVSKGDWNHVCFKEMCKVTHSFF